MICSHREHRIARLFGWSIGFLCVVLGATSGCNKPNEYVEPPPPEVTVRLPEQRDVTDFLEFTGTTAALESVDVRARVQGFLQSMRFKPGDDVEKDALLFEIEPDTYKAKLAEANAALSVAKTKLELAVTELARTTALVKRNADTKENLDIRTAQRDGAEAEVGAAKANVSNAELQLGYTKVKTPIAGRVARNLVDVGNLVGAGESTLLTSVVNDKPIYAYFTLNERDLLRIMKRRRDRGDGRPEKSDKPELHLGLSDESGYPHEGQLDYVDPTVDPDTGTIQLRGLFPNEDESLIPGLFVRIRAPVNQRKGALLVTERALGADQGGQYLLVVNDKNEVEQRPVEVGASIDDLRVIESGLKPDERVIINGLQRAAPGSKVRPIEADDPAPPGSGNKEPAPKTDEQPNPIAETPSKS